MQQATLTNRGFRFQEVARPNVGRDELLVRMVACGVCSGDLHLYQERTRIDLERDTRWLGHEASGVVAAAGPDVTGFAVGDRVTSLAPGGYADYFIAKPDQLVKLPANVDFAEALGEAIACCVHAGNRFQIKPGDKVAIVGCGFMGLICQQLARWQHAGLIVALDPVAERRQLSHELGAVASYDPSATNGAAIVAAHGAFDVVIEAAGSQSAIDISSELVAEHGRLVLVGYHQSQNGQRQVNMRLWNYKAIDVVNGHVRRPAEKLAAMHQGMQLMAQGAILTKRLIDRYPLAALETAFDDLAQRKNGLYKAVILGAVEIV